MPSVRVLLRALVIASALVAPATHLTASAGEPAGDPLGSHVRGATPRMRDLIAIGESRSATFRDLVAQLNRSDIVVYLEMVPDLPSGIDGRLSFLTSAGGVRYLRAQVTTSMSVQKLVSVAAHELQHALEVAAHPEVRDGAGLALLYERIGTRGTTKNRYDTAAAQLTGKRVRAELG